MENKRESCVCEKVGVGDQEGVTKLFDRKMELLIAAGAAMAANCEPCLNKIVPALIEEGASKAEIQSAVEMGQTMKDKPATIMKEAADMLAGTNLLEKSKVHTCPAEKLKQEDSYKGIMLIAVASAMAANCESCINQAVLNLIEAGADQADIRAAIVVGQNVKDQAADKMKEVADILTGSSLYHKMVSGTCLTEGSKNETCCA